MADLRGLSEDLNIIAKSDLEITPLGGSFSIIQQLDDQPNDVGGLTAQELKAKFDQAGLTIQAYINETLIPEVLGAEATEEQRQASEAARQANEAAREANEAVRETQEAAREAGAAALTQALTEHAQGLETELRADAAALEAQIEAREQALEVWEDYDAGKAYVPGNKAAFQGSSYVNTSGCTGIAPTGPTAAEQAAGAAHWLMIAAKGRDGTGDLTTDAADGRYIRQAGGDMTGPLAVLSPTENAHAAPKGYVDAAAASAETAAKNYADSLKTAVDTETFSRAQTLTAQTAALYGKGPNAVPDDVLAEICHRLLGGEHITVATRVYQHFTSSTSWTAPADMDGNTIFVVARGGGGGGGGAGGLGTYGGSTRGGAGGGGGGGYIALAQLAVDKAETYLVVLGAGGPGGAGGGNIDDPNTPGYKRGGPGGTGSRGGHTYLLNSSGTVAYVCAEGGFGGTGGGGRIMGYPSQNGNGGSGSAGGGTAPSTTGSTIGVPGNGYSGPGSGSVGGNGNPMRNYPLFMIPLITSLDDASCLGGVGGSGTAGGGSNCFGLNSTAGVGGNGGGDNNAAHPGTSGNGGEMYIFYNKKAEAI